MDIIKFTHDLGRLDRDKDAIERPLLAMDEYLKLAAMQLNAALDTFWSFPEERICAILNDYGIEQVTAIFTAHAEKAGMLNALLASRGIEPLARIGAARELQVDPETGVISLKPLPVPEPVVESLPVSDPYVDPVPVNFSGQSEPNVNN